ncbi:MAG: hypothetical protein JO101_03850 [Candidatus Eremiobacteraeota bacterium]|nr:hypothetical protein [Candidatus Eremiobacteraeota bacterium]MBV8354428.1 hypothetical protein [Candidatus Eremiobacteraeota bacterium]
MSYLGKIFKPGQSSRAIALVRDRIDPSSPLSEWKVETDQALNLDRVEAYNRAHKDHGDAAMVYGFCPGEYRVFHGSQTWRVTISKNGTNEVAVQETQPGAIDLYEDTQGKCLDGTGKTYASVP